MKYLIVKKYSLVILFFLFAIELLLHTYCQNIFGAYITPIFLFLVSALIGFLPIYVFYDRQLPTAPLTLKTADKTTLYTAFLFIISMCILIFVVHGRIIDIYKCFEVNAHYSDIIPTIQVMCKRFINGVPVYTNIEDFGYYLPAQYLPMHWLPFLPAELFHFDYRWITLSIWILCSVLILIYTLRKDNQFFGIIYSVLFSFLMIAYIYKDASTLGWTVEFMLAAFYMLFVISFFSNNLYFKAITIVLCLLSRYSFALFLPLYGFVFLYKNKRRDTLKFALITVLFFAIILLPSIGKNWSNLMEGFKYYNISGLGEWKHLNNKNLPLHLFNGNGFASWFYTFLPVSLEEKFSLTQKIHVSLLFVICFMFGIIYYFIKDKIDYRIYLLGCFKIYLAVFYGFIQVPYNYLFVVPLMISITTLLITNYYFSIIVVKDKD